MSYILDALRRADAERDRGQVPGIHAQQFSVLPGDDEAPSRTRWPLWGLGTLVVALAAALGWNLLGRDSAKGNPPIAALPTPAPAMATAPMVAAPTVAEPGTAAPPAPKVTGRGAAGVEAPPANGSSAVPARRQNPRPIVRPTPQAPAVPRLDSPADRLAGSSSSSGALPAPGSSTTGMRPEGAATSGSAGRSSSTSASSKAVPPSASTQPADSPNRIYQQRDLPEAIRRELPPISVSGSTYSAVSANRMLMVGGQIFHEGDTLVGGLVLQQIKPHGAVFAFKGYRYEATF